MGEFQAKNPLKRVVQVSINTDDGDDYLFLSMQGTDGFSELSDYTVRLLHPLGSVQLSTLLGAELTLSIQTNGSDQYRGFEGTRYLHGLIVDFTLLGPSPDTARYFVYQARVKSWLYLATLKQDCRIFQNLTVPEIIEQVLSPYAYNFEFRVLDQQMPRAYCVQYNETDFQFVSRLLEAEGWYYNFEHDADKHTLVFYDDTSLHKPVANYERIPYLEQEQLNYGHTEYMLALVKQEQVRSGHFSTSDYRYTNSRRCLGQYYANRPIHRQDSHEVYEWPGHFADDEQGERYGRNRMQELHTQRDLRIFQSTARGLGTGAEFTLYGCPQHEENQTYLILKTYYDILEPPYQSHAENQADTTAKFRLEVTVQNHALVYRTPRRTPLPRTHGPQSALVVGPEGHEIWTNQLGQVKVHFYWDRYSQRDEHSSCWIRVVSPWASKHYGAVYTPRIGDEVIVDFIDGNPDRPIIIGSAYNDANEHPWDLPEHATQSGVCSRSTPNGELNNFNAIRFEDKKGEEQIWVHAERNHDIEVKRDETHRVKRDRKITVDRHEHRFIGGIQTETVQLAKAETIGLAKALSTGLAYQVTVGTLESHTVGQQIQFICGNSKLVLTPDAIHLESPQIHLKAVEFIHADAGKDIFLNSHTADGAPVMLGDLLESPLPRTPATAEVNPLYWADPQQTASVSAGMIGGFAANVNQHGGNHVSTHVSSNALVKNVLAREESPPLPSFKKLMMSGMVEGAKMLLMNLFKSK